MRGQIVLLKGVIRREKLKGKVCLPPNRDRWGRWTSADAFAESNDGIMRDDLDQLYMFGSSEEVDLLTLDEAVVHS
jgi:hypothetical protein